MTNATLAGVIELAAFPAEQPFEEYHPAERIRHATAAARIYGRALGSIVTFEASADEYDCPAGAVS